MNEAQQALLEEFDAAERIVFFTGAGISTECGIPDFRSPGGLWSRFTPIDFQEFVSSPAQRLEAWRRKFAIDDEIGRAKPGKAHAAVADLVATGRAVAVITQNIDALHSASGVPDSKLVELHGNGTYAACLDCGERAELATIRAWIEETGTPPDCGACGGLVKSATISFGQPMPAEPMARAAEATAAADLFVVLGSSLAVRPAADFPLIAKRNGARLVIVNREATPLDGYADLVLRGDIGTILAP